MRSFALACLLAWCAGAHAAALRVLTSHLPPLAMENGGKRPGALHELVAELGKRAELPIEIEFVPWQRAIFLSKQAHTAIFPLTRNAQREHQYRWLAKLYATPMAFVGMKNRTAAADWSDNKQLRVGALRGSVQAQWLKDAGYQRVVEAASVRDSLRYLDSGMVDASYGSADILQASIRASSGDPQRFIVLATKQSSENWLAASRDASQAEVEKFQKALKSMQDDGSYQKILRKYELTSAP